MMDVDAIEQKLHELRRDKIVAKMVFFLHLRFKDEVDTHEEGNGG